MVDAAHADDLYEFKADRPLAKIDGGVFIDPTIQKLGLTVGDHVTLTGDCQTGSTGGHIELNGTVGTLVDSCVVENFGNCGPDGHLDHGIYIASTESSVVVIEGERSSLVQ